MVYILTTKDIKAFILKNFSSIQKVENNALKSTVKKKIKDFQKLQ